MVEKTTVQYIVGIDEAGRGPIAGGVCVGAVMVRVDFSQVFFEGIRDSKKLRPQLRELWYRKLSDAQERGDLSCTARWIGSSFIDKKGISKACALGIERCLARLGARPEQTLVLLDGSLRAPAEYVHQETIVRGDDLIPLISAASIMAKVTRDRRMERLSERYPQYGFEQHKGYGTHEHYKRVRKYGMCDIHRRSFLTRLTEGGVVA